jgi:hypothetical protein
MEDQTILVKQDFESLIDNTLKIHFNDDYILQAEVISVFDGMIYAESIRTPFSIIFRTDQKNQYFEQGTYPIIHPEKGEIPVFLVPIGPDEFGMRYEAVFN